MNLSGTAIGFVVSMQNELGSLFAAVIGTVLLSYSRNLASAICIGLMVGIATYAYRIAIAALKYPADQFYHLYPGPREELFWWLTLPQALASAMTGMLIFLTIHFVFGRHVSGGK